jgi:hypothetical protein
MIQSEYTIPKLGTLEESLAAWGRATGLDQQYRICLFKEDVYLKPPLSDAYKFYVNEHADHFHIERP